MKPNRRTLLKGTGALTTAAILGSRFRQFGLAQAPNYEAQVIYEFTEFAGDSYSPVSDGYIWPVSSDGVIAGRDRVGGVQVPATWDLTGTRTLLDTGDFVTGATGGVFAGPAGYVVGNLFEAPDFSTPSVGVRWSNGVPEFVNGDASLGGSINANTVNASGVVGGSMDSMPARWTDSQVEQLPLPDGAAWSSIYILAENGDAYGYSGTADGVILAPFIWKADGSVEDITLPPEVEGPDFVSIGSATFAGVFDNGDFVLTLGWKETSGIPTGSWVYQGGVPTPVQANGENTSAQVSTALTTSNMIGNISGSGTSEGAGRAQWIDGVPYILDDLTTLPAGVALSLLRGITTDGVIVATTPTSGSTAGPPYILALHPVG